MPSSFSTAHPSALEYSSRLPVSVCGTGCYARFSWKNFHRYASPEGSTQLFRQLIRLAFSVTFNA
ncbi:MAG: hypothetical protein EBQ65_04010 [Chitinophagaceae bacterium]|nr:hypothetical protein [Chitinophagaceae bacterium]